MFFALIRTVCIIFYVVCCLCNRSTFLSLCFSSISVKRIGSYGTWFIALKRFFSIAPANWLFIFVYTIWLGDMIIFKALAIKFSDGCVLKLSLYFVVLRFYLEKLVYPKALSWSIIINNIIYGSFSFWSEKFLPATKAVIIKQLNNIPLYAPRRFSYR